MFGVCPLLRVAESSWIHSSYLFMQGKGEVWARKLWFKKKCHKSFVMKYSFDEKNILNHPHQLFKLSLYFSNFIFERRSLSLQIFNFNNILFSFWLFFLACRDNVTPKFYYKIRKKEDTIFHCFSSFYIVIKYVSFKEWNARFFFFLNKVKN